MKELCSGVKETRMTQKQLKDAVDKLIRTNPYSNIKVADVLSHKKHLKLYTYHERCVYITEKKYDCAKFIPYKISGVAYFYYLPELELLKFDTMTY